MWGLLPVQFPVCDVGPVPVRVTNNNATVQPTQQRGARAADSSMAQRAQGGCATSRIQITAWTIQEWVHRTIYLLPPQTPPLLRGEGSAHLMGIGLDLYHGCASMVTP